jgi:hypothetical protein
MKGCDVMPEDYQDGHSIGDLASIVRRVESLMLLKERHEEMIREAAKEAVAIDARVRVLEAYAQTRAITEAREDERDKVLYERLSKIERKTDALEGIDTKIVTIRADVDAIKGNFSKLGWAVITAITIAVVAFVIKGGLNI